MPAASAILSTACAACCAARSTDVIWRGVVGAVGVGSEGVERCFLRFRLQLPAVSTPGVSMCTATSLTSPTCPNSTGFAGTKVGSEFAPVRVSAWNDAMNLSQAVWGMADTNRINVGASVRAGSPS